MAIDLKSVVRKDVGVQVPPAPPTLLLDLYNIYKTIFQAGESPCVRHYAIQKI